jgi:surfeit locus 1 family protein
METALGASLLRGQILLAVDEPNGYERAWTPYYGISPERHQAYAVQWYALAVTLLVLYLVVSVKRPGLR